MASDLISSKYLIPSRTLLESWELKYCSLNVKVSGRGDGEDDSNEDELEDVPPVMWSVLDGFGKVLNKLKEYYFFDV